MTCCINFRINASDTHKFICLTVGKRSLLPYLANRKLNDGNMWENLFANEDSLLRLTCKITRNEVIPDRGLPEEILTEWLNEEEKQEPDLQIFL